MSTITTVIENERARLISPRTTTGQDEWSTVGRTVSGKKRAAQKFRVWPEDQHDRIAAKAYEL